MKILNFGSCNIDYVYNVSEFVRAEETISALSTSKHPGGKGLNQAIAAYARFLKLSLPEI